ncbi:MAG: Asp-tRNA(Asn)/Glu-tRNA(Gln) amidotransferase GatCAB subunit B, partial [Candidatus Omnitrophica bacterium]|nr:Asp-tRNA(Asn)/Glu-tRNA(Gln) amidotransferase GatCAB subunit B [Candidatus Omnitrophota bacterium]
GQKVAQETRLYDSARGVTESMRSKEEAHDYRYFPEPDLSPFDFDKSFLDDIGKSIPELPEPKKKRFIADYGLSDYDAMIMVSDKALADYFEKVVALCKNAKTAANWLMGDISAYMKEKNLTVTGLGLKPEHLSDMLKMIDSSLISGKTAKTLLVEMIETHKSPEALVKEKGLEQISDEGAIEKAIAEVMSENQKIVNDFKGGKSNAIMALVGKVMAKTKGKANPGKVNELLRKKLA